MKLHCPKCDKQVKPKSGRSKKVMVLLAILGFLTCGLGWVIIMFYDLIKPKYQCPNCGKTLKK